MKKIPHPNLLVRDREVEGSNPSAPTDYFPVHTVSNIGEPCVPRKMGTAKNADHTTHVFRSEAFKKKAEI